MSRMAVAAPDAAAQALIHLYRRAHEQVRLQVQAAVRSGALGTEAQRRRQMQAIRVILARLERDTNPLMPEALGRPYGAAAIAVDVSMGLGERRFAFAGVHEQAVAIGVAAMHARLKDAMVNVGREADDLFRRVQLEHAALGIAGGDKRTDVSDRMVADLRAHGVTAFVDRRGARWSLERYAAMTVRTNTREMVSLATANRLVENGLDLVQISWHDTTCDICRDYERMVISLTGDDDRYPKLGTVVDGLLIRLSPFHPNCEHISTPAATSFDDFEREMLGADPPPVPVDPPAVTGPDTAPRGPDIAPDDVMPERAPERPTPPASKRVGDVLAGSGRAPSETAQVAAALDDVAAMVDQLVRFPDSLETLPVRVHNKRGQHGAFEATLAGPKQITMNLWSTPDHDDRVATLVHELGHFIDYAAIHPGPPSFSSELDEDRIRAGAQSFVDDAVEMGADREKAEAVFRESMLPGLEAVAYPNAREMKPWRDAVDASAAVKALRTRATFGSSAGPLPRDHPALNVDYYLDWAELFARSFTMWVAVRTGNAALLAHIAKNRTAYYDRDIGVPYEWTVEDFEPIAKALDDLFATRGMTP